MDNYEEINIIKEKKKQEKQIKKLFKTHNEELKTYFEHIIGEIGDTECLTSLKQTLVNVIQIINKKLKTEGGKRKSSKKSKKSKRKTKQKKAKKRTKRRKN